MKITIPLRRVLAIVAFAVGFAATPACALDVNIGDLSGTSFAHGQTYAGGTLFTDTFHFDLSAASGSFSAVASQLTLLNFFNIANFSLTLTPPSGSPLVFTPGPGGGIVTDVHTLLQGNDYITTVSGLVNGTLGGGYTVLLAVAPSSQVSPIPEPATWTFLLAGIAFFVVARRRRSAT